MSVAQGLIDCPQLQTDLLNQFTASNPLNARVAQGFGQWVSSPANDTGIIQRQIDPGAGKIRKVELLYTQQICADDVSDDAIKSCVQTNEAGQLSQTYEIDPTDGVSYGEKFDITQLAYMCKDNGVWFAQRIQAIMDALEDRKNQKLAYQAILETGTFGKDTPNVDAARKVATIQTRYADGKFDLQGLKDITYAAMNTGYPTVPYLFGFGEILNYFRDVAAGCCAADGLNIANYNGQNGSVFVPDKYLDQAFLAAGNDGGFLMTTPGAFQLLTYNEYKGSLSRIDAGMLYQQVTIMNPKTGTEYDMTLKNDCGVLHVHLKLAFKLVTLPEDMYPTCSDFDGVNFVNAFAIDNPVAE